MSATERSLRNLMAAIERLDHAAVYFEKAQAGKQRDMFAAPPPPPPAKNNGTQDDMLARRLDVAIRRVEELLEEA